MNPKQKTLETVKAVLIALIAALVLRQFVVASYNVPTSSMEDTILVGDFMFVNKFIYGARTPTWLGIPFTDTGVELPSFRFPSITQPKPGDIVVFDYPRNKALDYIKRCVAVGGQTVEVRNKDLYVDNQRFNDPPHMKHLYPHYIVPRSQDAPTVFQPGIGNPDNFGPYTVPEGHYFMMGDNRDNSQDSRIWGPVPPQNVGGKPLMIWLSWNNKSLPGYRFYDKIRWARLGMVLR